MVVPKVQLHRLTLWCKFHYELYDLLFVMHLAGLGLGPVQCINFWHIATSLYWNAITCFLESS